MNSFALKVNTFIQLTSKAEARYNYFLVQSAIYSNENQQTFWGDGEEERRDGYWLVGWKKSW